MWSLIDVFLSYRGWFWFISSATKSCGWSISFLYLASPTAFHPIFPHVYYFLNIEMHVGYSYDAKPDDAWRSPPPSSLFVQQRRGARHCFSGDLYSAQSSDKLSPLKDGEGFIAFCRSFAGGLCWTAKWIFFVRPDVSFCQTSFHNSVRWTIWIGYGTEWILTVRFFFKICIFFLSRVNMQ